MNSLRKKQASGTDEYHSPMSGLEVSSFELLGKKQ